MVHRVERSECVHFNASSCEQPQLHLGIAPGMMGPRSTLTRPSSDVHTESSPMTLKSAAGIIVGEPAMPAEVTFRRSTADDAPGVHACVASVASERRFLSFLESPAVGDIASFISQPDVVQVVAVDSGTIVGWADVRRMRYPGFRHRGVLGMGVVSTHRRQGIGARLLANALEAAEALDLARIELQVFRSNEPAVHLYRSKGFQVEGE